MTEQNFLYWLRGFFELAGTYSEAVFIAGEQKDMIREHIALVRAVPGTHSVLTSIEGLLTLEDPTDALQAVLKAHIIQVTGAEGDGGGIGLEIQRTRQQLDRESFTDPTPAELSRGARDDAFLRHAPPGVFC